MKSKSKNTADALAELFGAAKEGVAETDRGAAPAPTKAVAEPTLRGKRRAWGDVGHAAKRQAGRTVGYWTGGRGLRYAKVGSRGGWFVLWQRMAPGRWYAARELDALLPEYAPGHGSYYADRARARGMTVRGAAPEGRQRAPGFRRLYLYRKIETAVAAPPRRAGKARLSPAEKARRQRERNMEWIRRNPDRVAYHARNHYLANRDRLLARRRERYLRDKTARKKPGG